MTKGKVTFYDDTKGFGFVRAKETNEDFFFHFRALQYTPCRMNDRVTFEVQKSLKVPGKLCAVNITIEE